ncbi:reprolysin-like metallopeptidase [Paraglaciecola sp.]|uniref:reprolysin-like metallopeptidase n=1 Tax=Paraglaciecola sp. TaxID=1920173 RepID=UPI00273F7B33|nr:tandem-95 repeat protein [Paraglaciecola sp.]MDP5030070.1 tandem-95 repeat protein [Paraglaciecola sp.]
MMRLTQPIATFLSIYALCSSQLATAQNTLWHDQSANNRQIDHHVSELRATARNARYLTINRENLTQMRTSLNKSHTLSVPLPNGESVEFSLSPSPILSTTLANKYPELMTYSGQQVDNANNYGRFSLSPQGFFGFYRVDNEWLLLSPQLKSSTDDYMVYAYKDAIDESASELAQKGADFLSLEQTNDAPELAQKAAPTGDQIRTYRLAISATGEYTQKFGGSVANVVAESMILVNRINQILLTDLAVQFELVDSEAVIFTNASTDPYTNNNAASDIESNQTTLDNLIGSSNYDIGHLLTTTGGGLAGIGVVCKSSFKAWGTTGSNNPTGERFYIDLVIHEMGHQLGARHTFNALDQSNCDASQRADQSAFEPGSGSTIMSYAGLCSGQNIQNDTDPYFHGGSIEEIRDYVDGFNGRSCGTVVTQDNAIPQITTGPSSYTIPANTPFMLDAQASDDDNDALLFNWDQVNPGGADGGTVNGTAMRTDNGANPLFRSFPDSTSSARYFPQLNSVVNNQLVTGEVYPSTDRTLTLRLTVKDNKGGVNSSDVTVNVVNNSQRFAITSPDIGESWLGLSQQTLRWNVADTHLSPFSCTSVDILMRTSSSSDFDIPLAVEVANSGEQIITVPNVSTNSARLMLKCSDNVFYTVNNANLSISAVEANSPPIVVGQNALSVNEDESRTISLADLSVEDTDSVYPDDFSLSLQNGNDYSLVDNQVIPDPDFNGQLTVPLTVNDGSSNSEVFALLLTVIPVNDAPEIVAQSSISTAEDTAVVLSLSNIVVSDPDSNFPSDFSLTVNNGNNYSLNGNSLIPDLNFNGELTVPVSVSDGSASSANFALSINVTPVNDAPVAQNDSVSVSQNSTASLIDVLANDTDIEDAPLIITNISYSGQGVVSISNQQISYQAANGFSGTESINYTISDGELSSSANLTVTVTPLPVTTPITPTSSSGGGSVHWQLLALLSSVVFFRISRQVKSSV